MIPSEAQRRAPPPGGPVGLLKPQTPKEPRWAGEALEGEVGKQQDQGRTPFTFFGRDRVFQTHPRTYPSVHSPTKSRTAPGPT